MAQQYALTLDLLLRVLGGHQQPYQLWTTVPAEALPAVRGNVSRGTLCQVRVQVAQGQVVGCCLRDQQERVLLEGPLALDSIRRCEQVVWTVQMEEPLDSFQRSVGKREPQEAMPLLSSGPERWSWPTRPPPCSVRPLSSSVLHTLSRRQRVVLCLLDGKRTLADLGTMLHLSDEQVAAVLDELAARHLLQLASEDHAPEG